MKLRRFSKWFFLFIAVLIALSIACAAPEKATPQLSLTVFSIGKADAMLLQFDGYSVMIDTGENGDGEELVNDLAARGVAKLDLLILTHFDKDHIGGADAILNSIPVDTVRLPAYESDSKQYRQMSEALNNSDAEVFRMSEDATFSIGSADFLIWTSTIDYNGQNDNEQSLVTKVVYGGKTFLFLGDAEESWLKELVYSGRNLTCDVLKLPHHGVYDKNLAALLAVTMPDYVIITDSVKKPAEEKTLNLISTFECALYRTMSGTVTMTLQNGRLSAAQEFSDR